jgi:hypothetical protein
MKLPGKLLSYALAVGVPFSALVGGVMWLVQPGPAISQEARPAPLPPRIADSIERKKPIPVEEPRIEERRPEPVKPAMQEANVSLAPAPVYSPRTRVLSPPVMRPRQRRTEQAVAREAPAVSVSSRATTVSNGRSDSPY